jgi:DNA polymerase-3 subunit alpha
MFGREILKFIIGEKYEQFKTIIEAANRKKFNYYLPNSCKNEILDSCEKYNKSVREMSYGCNFDIEIKNDTITDTKGEFFANKIYCPNTYKLLRSDYQPIIIKEINPVGVRHVYDIEVDNDHNYVANNLIVHNCFAKKTGTQDCIPVIKDGGYITEGSTHHIDGYIKTMKNRYNISEEKSEEDIVAFIQVIEDASSYLFSLNHSQPYSFMGYACAYLRYYYPTEFITCCLNINKDNSEKTTSVTEYAKKVGVKIVPIRFGYSRSDYSCDAANKTIYKGVSSVKNLNEIVSEQLYELSQERVYDNFIDLLHDITVKTSCNSRQLDILIKLNYFSDFGEINELLQKTELFQNLFDNKKGYKKQMKKSTAQKKGIDEKLLAKYSDDFKPSKTNPEDGNYPGLDSYKLLTEFISNAPVRSLTDKIKDQKEYLSYIQEINPDADPREVYVSELSTNYSPTFDAYCLKTGETKKLRVYKTNRNGDGFNKKPFSKGDFIYLQKCEKKSKTRVAGTDEHGNPIFEPIPGEFNWWVTKYDVLTKK